MQCLHLFLQKCNSVSLIKQIIILLDKSFCFQCRNWLSHIRRVNLMSFEKELPIMFSVKVFEWLKCFCLNKQNFTFMLPCIVIDFFLSNQPDALIIQIYSVIKIYMFRASSLQGRIKLFGAPRQWKHFRPLFQAVFLSKGGYYPPDWVKHHASQSQDRNNKYFILYLNFVSIIKF